eukprot:91212_1
MFHILYIIGALLPVSMYIYKIITYRIKMNKYGYCIFYAITDETIWIYIITAMLWYYIWDWFVLYLYVQKVNQLKHDTQRTHQNEQTSKTISAFLHKILFLTIFNEIISFLVVFGAAIGKNGLIELICIGIDESFNCFVIFLMMEQNHSLYIRFMNTFRCGLCCFCCSQIVNKSMYQYEGLQHDAESTINDTNDIVNDTKNRSVGIYPLQTV